jgi:DNA-binding LytR/AlgR family response regulator
MVKIAVCDDEQLYLDKTRAMLDEYAAEHDVEITEEAFVNPSALLDSIEAGERCDIYLLDIYMPGVSGMSVATELRSKGVRSPIIFLTSSTEHAVEAFGVDATHYLLKPYTQQNFFTAMDKAMQSITSHKDDSIVLKVDNEYRSIPVSKIICCEAEDKYQRLYLEKDERLLIRISGTELYKQLSGFDCFYRCGRAHIVNLSHISRVTQDGASFKSGMQLSLPHTVLTGLRKAFFDYFN